MHTIMTVSSTDIIAMSAKYYNTPVPCKAFLQTYGKQCVKTMRAEYKPKIAPNS